MRSSETAASTISRLKDSADMSEQSLTRLIESLVDLKLSTQVAASLKEKLLTFEAGSLSYRAVEHTLDVIDVINKSNFKGRKAAKIPPRGGLD